MLQNICALVQEQQLKFNEWIFFNHGNIFTIAIIFHGGKHPSVTMIDESLQKTALSLLFRRCFEGHIHIINGTIDKNAECNGTIAVSITCDTAQLRKKKFPW